MSTFPQHYLENAVAAQVTPHGRRHPMYGNQRLPSLHIALRDGTQRLMSYATVSDAHDAEMRFLTAAFAAQGRLGG